MDPICFCILFYLCYVVLSVFFFAILQATAGTDIELLCLICVVFIFIIKLSLSHMVAMVRIV